MNALTPSAWYFRGKQKFDAKSLFIHIEAKDDKAAINKLNYLLDVADINAAHYFKPVRTDFPVVDDLPQADTFDDTWCDRYQLGENQRTWEVIRGAAAPDSTPVPAAEPAPAVTPAPVTAPQQKPTSTDQERFSVTVCMLVMGIDPDEAKGRDVHNAKLLIEMKEVAWVAWHNDLSQIPGIEYFPAHALYELTLPGMKNLSLIHDAAARRSYIRKTLQGHPLLPHYSAENRSQEDEKKPAQQNTIGVLAGVQKQPDAMADAADQHAADAQTLEAAPQVGPFFYRSADGQKFGRVDLRCVLDQTLQMHGYEEISAVEYEQLNDGTWTTSNEGEKTEVTTAEESPVKDLGGGRFGVDALFKNSPLARQEPVSTQMEPEQADPVPDLSEAVPEQSWPTTFEPGRYPGMPNHIYHAANGISSTMLKDARVSLLFFYVRHVARIIQREETATLAFGNLVHTLALQPETLELDFNIEPIVPAGAFTTIASMKAAIEAYNAALPAGLSTEDIQARIVEWNKAQRQPFPLGADVTDTGYLYSQLPSEFQTIPGEQKHTGAAMKACIKEYNATLPALLKTTGSREELLSTLETFAPQLAAQERQRPQPVNTSGSKDELTATVKRIRPDAVFADELIAVWKGCEDGRIPVTQKQMHQAKAIQQALFNHPSAGPILQHPKREVEVSYFGFDEDTGAEVRVRPDLEINLDHARLGFDLKTISMWGTNQDELKFRLHREIISRGYHISAAMYCDIAQLDQFYWIFVNTDENYNWVIIVEASGDLLELGRLEYKKTLRAIDAAHATGEWPAPITDDYPDVLNDFDLRRLEYLQKEAEAAQ